MIYENVGNWRGSLEETGGYRGVTMTASASAGPVASLCHPPSPSAGPPPRWMLHVFDRSARDGARPRGPVLHGQPA